MPPDPGARARRVCALLSASVLPLLAAAVTALVGGAAGASAAAPAEHPGLLAQYGYRARVPAGWRHTGGLPERRRSLLTPAGRPAGSDVISVERTPLGYDATAEPDRALRELRERYRRELAVGTPLAEFTLSTRVAGRDVAAYRQAQPERGAQVEWYVLFDRDAQLSVGCQHTPAGAAAVRAACAEVIASLRVDT